jgi:MoxR-like ATPase
MADSSGEMYYRACFLKNRYDDREDQQWSELFAAADQTTSVLRRTVRSLVETHDRIDDHALTTLFTLCQNVDDGPSVAQKRQRVRELELPDDDTERIVDLIDESIGSVGAAMQKITLHVGGKEEVVPEAERALHACFERLINADPESEESELLAAVSDLIDIKFRYVQSGRMSPILHYLAPQIFPVVNGRSLEAMERCFDQQLSGALEDYVDVRETYIEIRDEFEFRPHFRDLDWFCNWILRDENVWTESAQLDEQRQYWQAQPGTTEHNYPAELWPIWQQENIITTGFDSGPVDEIDDLGPQASNLVHNMSPGDIVVAKGGHHLLLGLGVVTNDGFEYRADEDTWITFENDGEADRHTDVRHVEWVWTVGADDPVNTSDWDMAVQFSNGTIHSYKSFHELRYKLLQAVGEDILPDVQRLEEISSKYISQTEREPRDVSATNRGHSGSDPEPAYYWVNQNNPEEIEEEYLDASVDDVWHHDLTVLDEGDIVFHYSDQHIIGHSTVVEEASIVEVEGEKQYRVDVDFTQFETPRPIDEIREYLDRDDVRAAKYYPLNKNAEVQENYLSRLTEEAAEYLLEEASEQHYFWLSAKPSRWKAESIADGGDVFYTAYNTQKNKRRIFSAFEKAEPGDTVLIYQSSPIQAIVAEGRITQGLHEEAQDGFEDPVPGITIEYERPVDDISWTELNSVPELEESSPLANQAQGSLFEVTASEYETILALEEPEQPPDEAVETLRAKLEPIDVSFDMPTELYFEEEARLQREIEASLNSGKHIIFTGPPGTGKTKLAKTICQQCRERLQQVDDYTFTTATSEWTAFDTIGGYMPTRTADSAGSDLEFSPRLFLKCFRRDEDGIVNEWLVIDEINRSDIDKAFGQLFSVLSKDSVDLPYERTNQVEITSIPADATDDDLRTVADNPDVFPVTPAWRLLATMNTYDKASLYEMSYAFMRRFNFVHVGIPELELADGTIRTSLLDPEGDDNYAEAWLADEETLKPTIEAVYEDVAVIWKVVNDYPRSIGPSIVRDILDFVDAYDVTERRQRSEALTAAIVGMIYPQLEGMRPETQKKLVRAFGNTTHETEHGDVRLTVDQDRLEAKAEDFFDIRFDNE